jgi:hypothetical protein
VAELEKYFGTIVTDTNYVHEKTNATLNSGNVSYHNISVSSAI